MLIAGDIVGTKTGLATYSRKSGPQTPLAQTEVEFVQIFARKGRFKDFVERMPVYIITTRAALVGAATSGLRSLSNLKNYEEAKASLAPV